MQHAGSIPDGGRVIDALAVAVEDEHVCNRLFAFEFDQSIKRIAAFDVFA